MKAVSVIGASNFDFHIRCKEIIKPDISVPSTLCCCAGGAARNIAYNLALLGTKAQLTSIIPDNYFGQFILDNTTIRNLDTTNMIKTSHETAFFCDVFDEFENYKFNDMNIINLLDVQHLPQNLNESKLIVFDLNISESLLEYIVRNSSPPLICEATSVSKCKKIIPYLTNINTLKCNLNEAAELASILLNGKRLDDVADMAQAIITAGTPRVFITLGPKGAFYADNQSHYMLRIMNTQAARALGAGDVFTSAIVYGMYHNLNSIQMLDFAVKLSSLTALSGKSELDESIILELDKVSANNYVVSREY